jgi:hypothetical protein
MRIARIDHQPHGKSAPAMRLDNVHRSAAVNNLDPVESAMTQAAPYLARPHCMMMTAMTTAPSLSRTTAVIDVDNMFGLRCWNCSLAGKWHCLCPRNRASRHNKNGSYNWGSKFPGKLFAEGIDHLASPHSVSPALTLSEEWLRLIEPKRKTLFISGSSRQK